MQKNIQVLGKIPKKVILACSGGNDSMAALDFMLSGRKEVLVAYFNHGTEHGREAEEFIKRYCEERGLKLLVGSCASQRRSNQSLEEYWREERLGWLESISKL